MTPELIDKMRKAAEAMPKAARLPFDPFAIASANAEFAAGLAMRPADLFQIQVEAARQWGDFWQRTLTGAEFARPRDRRFAAPAWQDDAWFRAIRDAYLLASDQLRSVVAAGDGGATVRFLLDQYLNAVAPSNFASTNPDVIKRVKETGGANLVQGFLNLLEDVGSG